MPPGWTRVQAICDYVHNRITFDYEHAARRAPRSRPTRSASACAATSRTLLITFCRCLNIPARYVNGYLGDIGVPTDPAPMDFSAWFEVFLDGRWYTFDARHNKPRIGRIVIARGRDATDVALINSFGPHILKKFKIWTNEVAEAPRSGPPTADVTVCRELPELPPICRLVRATGAPVRSRGAERRRDDLVDSIAVAVRRFLNSPGFKFFLIGGLVLALPIPMLLVWVLISEREQRARACARRWRANGAAPSASWGRC